MALASSRKMSSPSPLPEKIGGLLREFRWLLLGGVAAYLALALWGFNTADPGWSRSVEVTALHNPTGPMGAWMADALLYLFGFSAWWWIVFLAVCVRWGIRGLNQEAMTSPGKSRTPQNNLLPLAVVLIGFVLLIVSSAALENLRFYSLPLELPLKHGGVIGIAAGSALAEAAGYTGATLLLLFVMAAGWSLLTGMSWIWLIETLGGVLETLWFFVYRLYERWQDARIGRNIAERREAVVEEKRRTAFQEPVLIEPFLAPTVAVSTKAEKRFEREKQPPLIPDAVAGGQLPPLHLLDPAPAETVVPAADTLEYTSRLIERKLADFGVKVQVLAALPGPVVTRYEIEPATGVKGSQIVNLARDLARALALVSIRVVETVPGKSCMALELPNPRRQVVKLTEIISSDPWNNMKSPLTITLGKDIGGQPIVADLAKMPHLLVAGTTGSGKSVGVNAMILSMLYKSEPDIVRMILIDPKMLELSVYEGIPHLLTPVVTDMRQAANALNWCVGEMERRYKLMSTLGVRNLAGFNDKVNEAKRRGTFLPNPFSLTPEAPEPLTTLPYIVIVIDELADLMMVVGKKVEELIARLAQKARAAGLHLILATQRPSVDVITGLIKANIPTRISFQVSSKVDSKTILDQMGAEALLGQGDMLYLKPGSGYPVRVHGAFVSDEEVHRVAEQLKLSGPPEYINEILMGGSEEDGSGGESMEDGDNAENDPMYDQAVDIVLKNRRPSISLVQRHLRIGYNRAARLIEAMEHAGLISAPDGQGKRDVLSTYALEEA